MFENTDVTIDDTERIILVEPEYYSAILPILVAAPDKVIGKHTSVLSVLPVKSGLEPHQDDHDLPTICFERS